MPRIGELLCPQCGARVGVFQSKKNVNYYACGVCRLRAYNVDLNYGKLKEEEPDAKGIQGQMPKVRASIFERG
mgnify:CR=1 FL=1